MTKINAIALKDGLSAKASMGTLQVTIPNKNPRYTEAKFPISHICFFIQIVIYLIVFQAAPASKETIERVEHFAVLSSEPWLEA